MELVKIFRGLFGLQFKRIAKNLIFTICNKVSRKLEIIILLFIYYISLAKEHNLSSMRSHPEVNKSV